MDRFWATDFGPWQGLGGAAGNLWHFSYDRVEVANWRDYKAFYVKLVKRRFFGVVVVVEVFTRLFVSNPVTSFYINLLCCLTHADCDKWNRHNGTLNRLTSLFNFNEHPLLQSIQFNVWQRVLDKMPLHSTSACDWTAMQCIPNSQKFESRAEKKSRM